MFHSFKRATHIVDGTFWIQEEQLDGDDVLQMRYVFCIKPVKEEQMWSRGRWKLIFFFLVCMCFGRCHERNGDALKPIKLPTTGSCFQPSGGASCWAACGCPKKMNYYLTRKLRVTGAAFFEKSWSRTLRSICSHLRWPLPSSTRKPWETRTSAPEQPHPHAHTEGDGVPTCHLEKPVRKTPSLWGWSARKPGPGVRTTAAWAGRRPHSVELNSEHTVAMPWQTTATVPRLNVPQIFEEMIPSIASFLSLPGQLQRRALVLCSGTVEQSKSR